MVAVVFINDVPGKVNLIIFPLETIYRVKVNECIMLQLAHRGFILSPRLTGRAPGKEKNGGEREE